MHPYYSRDPVQAREVLMAPDVTIVIASGDEGHITLVKKNLKRAGIENELILFRNAEALLNFMLMKGPGPHRGRKTNFLLILDTKMKGADGVDVLRQIKQDDEIQKVPVIMLTTAEDDEEMVRCHMLGCNTYLQKPVDFRVLGKTVREAVQITDS